MLFPNEERQEVPFNLKVMDVKCARPILLFIDPLYVLGT